MDTPASTAQALATVVAVVGRAYARDPHGQLRALKPGDVLRDGETVITAAGSHVEFATPDGQVLELGPRENFLFEAAFNPAEVGYAPTEAADGAESQRIIQAFNSGSDIDHLLEEPAAGLGAGGQQEGHDFVRLERIVEPVTPLSFQFGTPLRGVESPIGGSPDTLLRPADTPPIAAPDRQSPKTDQPLITVLANDTDPNGIPSPLPRHLRPHGTVSINPDGTLNFTPTQTSTAPPPSYTP